MLFIKFIINLILGRIYVTIKTPVFEGPILKEWVIQSGWVDICTYVFTPDYTKDGKYKVYFDSFEEIEKCIHVKDK